MSAGQIVGIILLSAFFLYVFVVVPVAFIIDYVQDQVHQARLRKAARRL